MLESLRTVCPTWLMDVVLAAIVTIDIDPLVSIMTLVSTLSRTMNNSLVFKDIISVSNACISYSYAIVERSDEITAVEIDNPLSKVEGNVVLSVKFIQGGLNVGR